MTSIGREAKSFLDAKLHTAAQARQTAALQLACGIDIDRAILLPGEERRRLLETISRRLRRERLKGLARHWSYDLDRHIALKQAHDRLSGKPPNENAGGGIAPPARVMRTK